MRPEGDRERWNRKHASVQVGGWTPRPWLVDHRALLDEQPGRRAFGCRVRARARGAVPRRDRVRGRCPRRLRTSWSPRSRARRANATWRCRRSGSTSPRSPPPLASGVYDVVTCFYFLLRPLLPALAAALAPGGLLFDETFTRDHVEVLGGDMNRDVLLGHNELLHTFGALRVLRYREAVIGEERRGRWPAWSRGAGDASGGRAP